VVCFMTIIVMVECFEFFMTNNKNNTLVVADCCKI
jgi:hypothetical protein